MSRYRGPRLRITRRLGFLPGLTSKRIRFQKKDPPGEHGHILGKKLRQLKKYGKNRTKLSQYSLGLFEKQKLRYNYGITERQLFNYVSKARRSSDSSGDVLLQLLEMRLDNIVYRLGLASSIQGARQLISHGHISVNQARVSFPSYQCVKSDTIQLKSAEADLAEPKKRRRITVNKTGSTVKSGSRKKANKKGRQARFRNRIPRHLEFDYKKAIGSVNDVADKRSIPLRINELLVIEFYSRKF